MGTLLTTYAIAGAAVGGYIARLAMVGRRLSRQLADLERQQDCKQGFDGR